MTCEYHFVHRGCYNSWSKSNNQLMMSHCQLKVLKARSPFTHRGCRIPHKWHLLSNHDSDSLGIAWGHLAHRPRVTCPRNRGKRAFAGVVVAGVGSACCEYLLRLRAALMLLLFWLCFIFKVSLISWHLVSTMTFDHIFYNFMYNPDQIKEYSFFVHNLPVTHCVSQWELPRFPIYDNIST